jgi:hypothetical protein
LVGWFTRIPPPALVISLFSSVRLAPTLAATCQLLPGFWKEDKSFRASGSPWLKAGLETAKQAIKELARAPHFKQDNRDVGISILVLQRSRFLSYPKQTTPGKILSG